MFKGLVSRVFRRSREEEEAEMKLRRHLDDSVACTLIRLVLENPGITNKALADKSRMDAVTVDEALSRLVGDGLVVQEPPEHAGYSIGEAAKTAVTRHLPLTYQCPGMMRE